MSGPARDLWIEIKPGRARRRLEWSGPARDLWIEIVPASQCGTPRRCRVPQGTCGLKSPTAQQACVLGSVGSRKGPVD